MDLVNPENTSSQTVQADMWTIGRTLQWMTERFAKISPTARLDAQLLLGQVLSCTRVQLYAEYDKPLSVAERDALRPLVRRRMRGEPVAYILQRKDWHDMTLYVDSRVLIPRPETETLFDLYSAWLASQLEGGEDERQTANPEVVIFDLCTGSGCLALALARRFPRAQVFGVDKSSDALAVAMINAERLGVRNISWMLADVTSNGFWEELKAHLDKVPQLDGSRRVCAVVSNPPYVSAEEWEQCSPEVREFEPRIALVPDGDTSLCVSESILAQWSHLNFACRDGETRFFLGMETGVDHPQSMLANRNSPGSDANRQQFSVFRADDSVRDFPLAQCHGASGEDSSFVPVVSFVCEDLEGKSRFLFASAVSQASLPSK
jgi:release factor glutamine methyltransferase